MQSPPPVLQLLDELRGMAETIAQNMSGPDVAWLWRPAPHEWSLTEVFCHLRDVELEVHQVRFRAVLNEDYPFIPGVSSNEWAELRGYRAQDGRAACHEFVRARMETWHMLSDLGSATWERQGSHAFFGATTLHELLNLVFSHDRVHKVQIANLRAGEGGLPSSTSSLGRG